MVAIFGGFKVGFSLGGNAFSASVLAIEEKKKAPGWLALSRKRLLSRVDSV
jgi:hypothetical protein